MSKLNFNNNQYEINRRFINLSLRQNSFYKHQGKIKFQSFFNKHQQSIIKNVTIRLKIIFFQPYSKTKLFIIISLRYIRELGNRIGNKWQKYQLGFNICIFAYGQTGSGKTHTMTGTEEDFGLMPRIFKNLFAQISNENIYFKITCSYFEIYNEKIFDLVIYQFKLQITDQYLKVREDPKQGVFIENLSHVEVRCFEEIYQLLQNGVKQRHTGRTNMNEQSSRSHSVFTIRLESRTQINQTEQISLSRMNFVDLAGSERQKQTGAQGIRLDEAKNINKSLSILGTVINALSQNSLAGINKKHVPYRDSQLTYILRDCLGGNSKTYMIATITEIENSETLNTLEFSQRVQQVQNKAEKNYDIEGDLQIFKQEIINLRKQIQDKDDFICQLQNMTMVGDKEVKKNSHMGELILSIREEYDQKIENYEKLIKEKDYSIQQKDEQINQQCFRNILTKENDSLNHEFNTDYLKEQIYILHKQKLQQENEIFLTQKKLQKSQNDLKQINNDNALLQKTLQKTINEFQTYKIQTIDQMNKYSNSQNDKEIQEKIQNLNNDRTDNNYQIITNLENTVIEQKQQIKEISQIYMQNCEKFTKLQKNYNLIEQQMKECKELNQQLQINDNKYNKIIDQYKEEKKINEEKYKIKSNEKQNQDNHNLFNLIKQSYLKYLEVKNKTQLVNHNQLKNFFENTIQQINEILEEQDQVKQNELQNFEFINNRMHLSYSIQKSSKKIIKNHDQVLKNFQDSSQKEYSMNYKNNNFQLDNNIEKTFILQRANKIKQNNKKT